MALNPKLVLFQVDSARLDDVMAVMPKGDPAAVLRLVTPADTLSVQAVCHEAITWQHLEDLKRAGAAHLLVVPVEKMLA